MPIATHCSGAQALPQHEDAQQHGDDRVGEVAEGRLHDVVVEGGEDVDQPVDEDQDAREQKRQRYAPVAQQLPKPAPGFGERQEDRAEHQREQDAPRHDLERVRGREQQEEEREKTPQQVREDGQQQPASFEAGRLGLAL